MESVYSKNYFNLKKYLFSGYLKWWQIKQNASHNIFGVWET